MAIDTFPVKRFFKGDFLLKSKQIAYCYTMVFKRINCSMGEAYEENQPQSETQTFPLVRRKILRCCS